ncbi:hypothetical protein [Actinoplanes nipponensis]|uniref:hypothetical protein n=1 Tax=Actinoplanes nipponensis TaxID=135950 RepID=UPI001EF2470C|nr:hypothetical protein [Actinoplanes nipponensis]
MILVPAAILFASVWGTISDKRDSTQREKQGVEYISSLAPLVSALAEAQSSALAGVAAAPGSLTAAVNGVAAVDQRLGDELNTRERWTGLNQKIDQLGKVTGDPVAVFQAHAEVTDLALALYDAVRDNSELVRDPDNDISHLQQAVAADLPESVVQVSRMGDLAQQVASGDAKTKAQLAPQFGAAVEQVNSSVSELTDNLQAAVDDTGSVTLSGNLVNGLDSFRRGVESLTRGANLGGAPNTATMATAQSQLQTSLSNLSGIVTREMTVLLDDRLDSLDTDAIVALASAAAAVLLVATAMVLPLTGTGRRIFTPVPGAGPRDLDPGPAGADPGRPDAGHRAPAYGETNPTRRERSGALR